MAEIPAPARERRVGRLLATLIVVLIVIGGVGSFLIARGRWWMLPVASVHGVEIDRLFNTTLVVTGIVFVLIHVVLAVFVWRYADRGTGRAAYWHDDRTLELTYTLIPAAVMITLVSMGAVVWAQVHSPPPPDAMVVEARGEQFGWLFRYPGKDGVFGRIDPARISVKDNPMGLDPADPASKSNIVTRDLHLVLARPVRVRIRSKDVIHSFYIPAFRVKQDAVPGMTVEIWFTPTREGDYELACAQLCGVGHYIMRGKVKVESQDAFDTWLAQQSH
ncbi:MAG: cytochrome c oxidase subunit II [Armatimonadetes bacterium 13_1_40CM_64_14]|nr:MAG: cytochrome c oxidase subunit II [Armatimonadetes bacterium 13_1_40CM_64_14]